MTWAKFIRQTVIRNTTTPLSNAIDLQLLPLLQKNEHVGLDNLKAFEQISSSLNPYEKLLFYSACGRIQYPDVPFEDLNIIEILYSPEKVSFYMNITNTEHPEPIYNGDIIFHSISFHGDNMISLASGAGRMPNNNFGGYIGKGYNFYCFMKTLEQLLINSPDSRTIFISEEKITRFHPVRTFIFYLRKAGFNLYPQPKTLLLQKKYEVLKESPNLTEQQINSIFDSYDGVYRNLHQEEQTYQKRVQADSSPITCLNTITISQKDILKHVSYMQLIKQAI